MGMTSSIWYFRRSATFVTSFEGNGDGGRSVECAGSNRVVSFVHEALSWLPGVLQNRPHLFGMLWMNSIAANVVQSSVRLVKRSAQVERPNYSKQNQN